MAITGIGSSYNNAYQNRYALSKKGTKEPETKQTADTHKYSDGAEYYAYLKDKYPCLTDSGYKVTISPAFLEKCINNPEKAELLEKSLAHLPIDHQNMTAFWSAQGAEVVNEQWIYDENGNCGGSTDMFVTSKNAASSGNVWEKTAKRKTSPQDYYEKRKQLREQLAKKQAEKKLISKQLEERQAAKKLRQKVQKKNALLSAQNAGKVIERYEAGFLRS